MAFESVHFDPAVRLELFAACPEARPDSECLDELARVSVDSAPALAAWWRPFALDSFLALGQVLVSAPGQKLP